MKAMGNEVMEELLLEAADALALQKDGRLSFGFTNLPI
jgi:hypothetical protein